MRHPIHWIASPPQHQIVHYSTTGTIVGISILLIILISVNLLAAVFVKNATEGPPEDPTKTDYTDHVCRFLGRTQWYRVISLVPPVSVLAFCLIAGIFAVELIKLVIDGIFGGIYRWTKKYLTELK